MARKRNSTPQGSTVFQVDAGSFTYSIVAENAVGDAALAFDEMTGQNSSAVVHDHSGPGKGSLLGINCGVMFPTDDDHRYSSYGTSGGIGYFFGHPYRMPRGETEVFVEADIENPGSYTLEVRDTSWAQQGETAVVKDGQRITGRASSLTPGALYFVLLKATLDQTIGNAHQVPIGYRIGQRRIAEGSLQGLPAGASDVAPVDHSAGVLTEMNWDTAQFVPGFSGWHAQLTTRLNRWLNGIWEHLSGAPAGGNSSYALTDFHRHSRETYTAEGVLDFPLLVQPFGAFPTLGDGDGFLTDNFGAPGLLTTSKTGVSVWQADMPDFPSTAAASDLKCCMLFSSPDDSKPSTTFYAQSVGSTERSTTVTWITGTRFGYAIVGGAGSSTGLGFTAGAVNQLLCSVGSSVSKTDGTSLRALGVHWYFEAP